MEDDMICSLTALVRMGELIGIGLLINKNTF